MHFIAKQITEIAKELRSAADSAEVLVADELWPLPKYREMLFANVIS
jgi:glutamine synthetase